MRAVACVSAAGGGVEVAGGVVVAQLGMEFERVGRVYAVVGKAGGNQRGRIAVAA